MVLGFRASLVQASDADHVLQGAVWEKSSVEALIVR